MRTPIPSQSPMKLTGAFSLLIVHALASLSFEKLLLHLSFFFTRAGWPELMARKAPPTRLGSLCSGAARPDLRAAFS